MENSFANFDFDSWSRLDFWSKKPTFQMWRSFILCFALWAVKSSSSLKPIVHMMPSLCAIWYAQKCDNQHESNLETAGIEMVPGFHTHQTIRIDCYHCQHQAPVRSSESQGSTRRWSVLPSLAWNPVAKYGVGVTPRVTSMKLGMVSWDMRGPNKQGVLKAWPGIYIYMSVCVCNVLKRWIMQWSRIYIKTNWTYWRTKSQYIKSIEKS